MRPIKHIVIHCSATPDGSGRFTIKDIDRMHRERGWKRVGYHFVIEVDGMVSVGRPVEEIGAHVEGSNATSIGICMIGTARFTLEQWSSLRQLVGGLQNQFPGAEVLGHRDFSPDKNGNGVIESWEWMKTCPGFDVRQWVKNAMVAPVGKLIYVHEGTTP